MTPRHFENALSGPKNMSGRCRARKVQSGSHEPDRNLTHPFSAENPQSTQRTHEGLSLECGSSRVERIPFRKPCEHQSDALYTDKGFDTIDNRTPRRVTSADTFGPHQGFVKQELVYD